MNVAQPASIVATDGPARAARPDAVARRDTLSIDEIWASYRRTQRHVWRNRLLTHYEHLVRRVAARMRARLPAEVELDDLVSAGTFGLFDAVRAFDPRRGVRFETFAAQRIRGAILDELRALDWVPRLARARAAQLARVRLRIEQELGRPATDEEIHGTLAARAMVGGVAALKAIGSFDRLVASDPEGAGLAELRRSVAREHHGTASDPGRDELEQAIAELSQTERQVVQLYYAERCTMKQIGRLLGLTESRVSRIHSSLLRGLQRRLRPTS